MEAGPSERGSAQVIKFHVIFTPSEELQAFRREVEALKAELGDLRSQLNRVELMYAAETLINGELQDLLRENGISYREAIKQYRGMV
mgnify:CR=1 FL=1